MGTTLTPMEQDQNKRSRILAYAIFIIWIAMQLAARFICPELNLFDDGSFLKAQGSTFALVIIFGLINFDNTDPTPDANWKVYGGILTIALSVFLAWIWIKDGLHYTPGE